MSPTRVSSPSSDMQQLGDWKFRIVKSPTIWDGRTFVWHPQVEFFHYCICPVYRGWIPVRKNTCKFCGVQIPPHVRLHANFQRLKGETSE